MVNMNGKLSISPSNIIPLRLFSSSSYVVLIPSFQYRTFDSRNKVLFEEVGNRIESLLASLPAFLYVPVVSLSCSFFPPPSGDIGEERSLMEIDRCHLEYRPIEKQP